MNEVISVKEHVPIDDVDIIIENRLNAHVSAQLATLSAKLDTVLEVHAKLDAMLDDAKSLMAEFEKSPIMAMISGGGLPGFGDFNF